jgi:ubiquinone/menaquinone biosynthesis C-methylase UbiE
MKRSNSDHINVFENSVFANRYYHKHLNMANKLGHYYTKELDKSGFKKGKILDVGCGFGSTLIVLAKGFPDAELFGIDLSKPLLAIAKSQALDNKLGKRITFLEKDVHKLPFKDKSIDVILNIYMAHLVKDPKIMFNEIARVLRKEGRLFIRDLRKSWWLFLEKEMHHSFSSKKALELIDKSELPPAKFYSGLYYWCYEK